MEKIININFHGRVIPIEETAYDNLKQYIDSLRRHFANEESSDEIINDIENRIAELFSDRLKRGALCINGSDLNAVIESIGRLEDIEAAEGEENPAPKTSSTSNTPPPPQSGPAVRGRFFRNADDKIIAGVCSGIAVRTGMDPVIVRILFVVMFGAFFWVYLLLWIIVPSQSIQSNITRRLYRNPDDKVIAGVCGGLSAYFKIDSWIPRLIFVAPLLVHLVFRGLHLFWWHWGWGLGPRIFAGSFGGTFVITYIVLWIAVPYAWTAADKLEMRGEKVDMNALKAAAQAKAAYGPYPRSAGSDIGRVIGIIFKAFFLFIGGTIALCLFGVLIGLVFAGVVALPLTDFMLTGWSQSALAWTGLALFLCIPILALTTWIVRRLMGVRSGRHYLGIIFSGLWVVGFFCLVVLCMMFVGSFSSKSMVEDTYPVKQPSVNKLYVNVIHSGQSVLSRHHGMWFDNGDWEGAPFHVVHNDSLWLNTVKVEVTQSADSLYHIYETRISRGATSDDAKALASHISFPITQSDSVINLPGGFLISNKDKFRNQQVLVTVEVPVGKNIEVSKSVDDYDWLTINVQRQRNFYIRREWNRSYNYRSNRDYIMSPSGLKNLKDSTESSGDDDDDDDE